MMRDENRVKKYEKCLILLNKFAGVVQWQNGSFPSFAGVALMLCGQINADAGDDLVQTFAGNGLASQQFLCDIANRCPVALHECNGLVAKLVRDRRPLGSHVLMTCSSPRLSHQSRVSNVFHLSKPSHRLNNQCLG